MGWVRGITGQDAARKAQEASQDAANKQTVLTEEARLRGVDALTGGAQDAIGSIQGGTTAAQDALGSSLADVLASIRGGFGGAQDALQTGATGQEDAITGGFGQARDDLSGIAGLGDTARQQQAALSGALGQEAFDQAFNESPAQKFLRERQQKALLQSSAAIGGLGGGNVRTALQEQAAGIASQDLQNQIANLNALSGQGLSASTNMANLAAGRGQALSGIRGGLGSGLANILAQQGQAEAGAQGQFGSNLANLLNQQGINIANIQQGLGTNLANLEQGQATQQSNILAALAQGLTGAAGAEAQAGQNLLNLGLQGAGLGIGLLSDMRAKENIKLVGSTNEGYGVYTYNYKGSPVVSMGVMAQEVEGIPGAVHEVDGVKFVDYSKIK